MSNLIPTSPPVVLPLPRVPIVVRAGTMDDVPFMDALQKKHSKQVGWMPRATFEGKIKLGHVLIAEATAGTAGSQEQRAERKQGTEDTADAGLLSALCSPLSTPAKPVGYCIGNDQYFKRDDVGVIYQMNVVPDRQRAFIGASLLKAQFERSAWGCKLYCCWCAQDIGANKFWEAMGFVPLAFRTGSRTKGAKGTPRVHIFWQRRIRAGDVSTPWWFPSQTSGGSIREDRLVLPIPPGTHWSDAMPILLPSEGAESGELRVGSETKPPPRRAKKAPDAVPKEFKASSGLKFTSIPTPVAREKPKPEPRKVVKNDPKRVAAARELRDRWLEHRNAEPILELTGKYDVSRAIDARSVEETKSLPDPVTGLLAA